MLVIVVASDTSDPYKVKHTHKLGGGGGLGLAFLVSHDTFDES